MLGIREYALDRGAAYTSVEEGWVADWLSNREALQDPPPREDGQPTYSLFAYPAEDNFAGVKVRARCTCLSVVCAAPCIGVQPPSLGA